MRVRTLVLPGVRRRRMPPLARDRFAGSLSSDGFRASKEALMRVNLAARAGRWSAMHWKTATVVWMLFVAAAIALGAAAGTRKLTSAEQTDGEAARAERMLAGSGFVERAGETVLVQSPARTADSRDFRQTIRSVVVTLRDRPEVTHLRSPLAGGGGQISRDRHSALIEFELKGNADNAGDRVQPVL